MKVKISRLASFDLRGIWLYNSEKWSIQQADRYYNLIIDEIEFIANSPESGKDFSHVRKDYFRTQVKSHFIFYKIDKEKEEIEIIRILHQRMDIQSRIDE